MESNDSPDISDRGETSDIPGLPLVVNKRTKELKPTHAHNSESTDRSRQTSYFDQPTAYQFLVVKVVPVLCHCTGQCCSYHCAVFGNTCFLGTLGFLCCFRRLFSVWWVGCTGVEYLRGKNKYMKNKCSHDSHSSAKLEKLC